ncbi:MAG: RnfABCDGE type electron transport complex subunit G [Magnetococcales bacterium]|nr:RnfABCDGE type electron transport complex subunit G [Magnetococcales bacterium]
MPDYLKMGVVLMVVGMVATAILSVTESATQKPIAAAKRQEMFDMLKSVLPEGFDNKPDLDAVILADKRLNRQGKPVTFYRARKGETNLGAAFLVTAPDGYAGDIEIMMSVTPNGTINLVQIVTQAETPGLGDKIVKTNWLKAFPGKSQDGTKWRVKKDGGDFDQFSGATITPRAVVAAVKRGLDFFAERKETIFKPFKPEDKP